MLNTQYKTLRLILGDQLNHQHSWFEEARGDTLYVMMEIRQETDYTKHHIQKIIGFFAAMRAFAQAKQQLGFHFVYLTLDDPENQQDLCKNLNYLITKYRIKHFEYQLPDEYRLDQQLADYCHTLKEQGSKAYDSEHFLTSRGKLQEMFRGKKQYLMESFYRAIRKEFNILMEGDQPVSGRWNYDSDNRKKLPKQLNIPTPLLFERDVNDIFTMIQHAGIEYIGTIDPEKFIWPVTRNDSLRLLSYFLSTCLARFGTYQDAMSDRSWSLFHSRLSFAMNCKLLSPLEVVHQAIDYWEEHQEEISLAQLEGFIRQIIGWREYMRGIYWAHMPQYCEMNYFDHQRNLPAFFWNGKTNMSCLSHAIQQSLEYAYAHHIQRLMITGNFLLLSGIHPDEVDQWYLGIYIDAIEWVEITNTRGMSQFADGGIVGTKPYCSSSNYIHKMSHYCGQCHYDRKKKYGDKACPFNSLYWNFYNAHRAKLERNPRIGMMYRLWDKMDSTEREAIIAQASTYLSEIETL